MPAKTCLASCLLAKTGSFHSVAAYCLSCWCCGCSFEHSITV